MKKKYDKNLYFLFSFSNNGKEALASSGDQSIYSDLVQTFSFRMGEYINLTTSKGDTIAIEDYAFQNTYQMSDANTLLLAFSKAKIKEVDWLEININEFGLNTGTLHFRFDQSDLKKVPDLDFKNI